MLERRQRSARMPTCVKMLRAEVRESSRWRRRTREIKGNERRREQGAGSREQGVEGGGGREEAGRELDSDASLGPDASSCLLWVERAAAFLSEHEPGEAQGAGPGGAEACARVCAGGGEEGGQDEPQAGDCFLLL
eukprot:723371-Hanusia_phi.AAC.2